ncbi:LysR family transcriptional regulator [Palleronia pelagia]|uniref:DNA-binding transcriptional regulator, LysR family n=1 Tax=Palleronia pelagia TaxID=387096 RepID=A0A1H8AL55_9RHOB|nr:LysR family transcriptional regulator [Palleronia pelagia]SEM71371.1 DNA-binding transcriptional regulator, LysR family [Palleronia pelagia]
MDVRQLKYFVATAESGQVSRAATQLSISQSSVTTAIRSLETELNAQLFHRVRGGMELSDPGRELLASARSILRKIEEAKRVSQRPTEIAGTISVAATYTVMGYFLPGHLDRLAQLFPKLDIRLSELTRESIEEGLLSNRFDLAVLLTSNLSNPDIESETLFRSERRLWISNDHPLYRQGRATFEEIAKEDFIMLTVDEAASTSMKYWGLSGHTPRIKLRTSSTEAVRSLVANGRGVTILSDMVYRPWSLEGRRISTLSTDFMVPSMDVGLAWRKGQSMSPEAQVLYEYFRQIYLQPRGSQ